MRQRTQVGIIGAGPAGLTLAGVLRQAGIDVVVVEKYDRERVEARARAGAIEHRVVRFLARHGLADRMLREGTPHGRCEFRYDGLRFSVPYAELSGGCHHYVYPQQFLVRDLADAFLAAGGDLRYSRPAVAVDPERAVIRVRAAEDGDGGSGEEYELECDFVAACDGFHGVSRRSVPAGRLRTHERRHGVGWLAVLAQAPPSTEEIIYALHEDGFAGHMLRTSEISRFYLQCPPGDTPAAWSEDRIWTALEQRLAADGWKLTTGPVTEKAVLDMRSVVSERMDHGRMFLVGDAAHIITPAGGKGMNLALGDAEELAAALVDHYRGEDTRLAAYSATRVPRIWQAQEFSHWLLGITHRPEDESPDDLFPHRLRTARLAQLRDSVGLATWFARSYVGA
ncbi:4-hydroxybenzoate 3-monooxygenase [Streptomyces sp. NPDC059740]|uniref:4-hydroxybenzoate 3-monooxygenase n=1 Tax=Streptomyces sp. NPDC059740 TaxID=3346926 RepID=UPI003651510A